jgi:hypothetical protein
LHLLTTLPFETNTSCQLELSLNMLLSALQVWQPPHKSGAPVPLVTVWSPAGLLLFLAYLAAMVYYFVVRIRYSLDLGWYTWWVAVGGARGAGGGEFFCHHSDFIMHMRC